MSKKHSVKFVGFSTSSKAWSESDQTKINAAAKLAAAGKIGDAVTALSGLKGSVPHAKQLITRRLRAGATKVFGD